MLLSDFFTVAFIPPLIVPGLNQSSIGETVQGNQKSRVDVFSPVDEVITSDGFFNNRQEPQRYTVHNVADPILQAIYEEEKRLDLSGGDPDIASEEAREIIDFQRQKFRNLPQNGPNFHDSFEGEQNSVGRFQFTSEGKFPFFLRPENERISVAPFTSTQIPLFSPPGPPLLNYGQHQETTTQSEEMRLGETTTTSRVIGRSLGLGGVFKKVRTGVGSAVGNIRKTLWGSPNLMKSTASPSNSMLFPEDPNTISFEGDENTGSTFNLPEPIGNVHCNGTQTEFEGACYNVLQQLPCPTGQWLVEDDETGKGVCVENMCDSQPNHAYFAGKCVRVRTEGDCHKGMTTYIFKNGEVECDCKEQYLFNQRDGNCYPAYRQGPCRRGEAFVSKITALGTLPATCVRSKCSKDGFFCNAPSCPNDRNCIELKSKCENGVFDIDPKTLAPKCLDFNTFKPDRIIGNVPTLACAPGSRRDILGTCRKPTKISFS